MKNMTAAAMAILLSGGASHAETLAMATIAPSLSQAITMATFANIVSSNLDDVEIEVAGGGAATLHTMEVARGNLDMSMTSPWVYNLMSDGKAMYANEPDAPELAGNLKLLMWFPFGQYHFATRADSGIMVLDDMEGASVFLGPIGGGAYNAAKGWVEVTTGLVANEDCEAIKASWATGFQAFLDGKVDVYTNGCLDPCGQFIRFTETEEIRFLGPESHDGKHVDEWLGEFRFRDPIAARSYDGQVNEESVISLNMAVGIVVRADLDEDLMYRITKAFWENVDQVTSTAPWARALNVEFASQKLGLMDLHPGAERFYREIGVLAN